MILKYLLAIFLTLPLTSLAQEVPASFTSALAAEENRWLYELLLPEATRLQKPAETFKSFRVHLEDSNQNFPRPEAIVLNNLNSLTYIDGSIKYAGIIRKTYKYDVTRTAPKNIVISVRVHLKNPTASDQIHFKDRIKQAENIWNQSRVATDFNYQFKFDIVTDIKSAHFSVNVLDSTRGPYDTNWGRNWNDISLAHEIGHMLGLGDEYQTITGKTDCWVDSIMCESWTGRMMPYHYYFILRRLI